MEGEEMTEDIKAYKKRQTKASTMFYRKLNGWNLKRVRFVEEWSNGTGKIFYEKRYDERPVNWGRYSKKEDDEGHFERRVTTYTWSRRKR